MRISEHAGRSFRTDKMIAYSAASSIKDHRFNCNTGVSLDNFKILNFSKFPPDLRILESLYIHFEKPLLNDMNSAAPLLIVS